MALPFKSSGDNNPYEAVAKCKLSVSVLWAIRIFLIGQAILIVVHAVITLIFGSRDGGAASHHKGSWFRNRTPRDP
jgi:hypothetical protein